MAGLLDFAMPQPSGGGGLLDFAFSDPGARLGLSLLAASSPKLRPLGQAMAQQDASKQQALQQQYIQSQIAENTSQAKMREQQLSMAQQKQNVMNGLFGVGGGSPLAGVTTGGGVNVPAASGAGIAGGGGGVESQRGLWGPSCSTPMRRPSCWTASRRWVQTHPTQTANSLSARFQTSTRAQKPGMP